MPVRGIFKKDVLVFDVPKCTGYMDTVNMVWVEAGTDQIECRGSLQPYVKTGGGELQTSLPEGFKFQDSKMYVCDTDLPTINDKTLSQAARTVIDNRDYYVANKLDFSSSPLSTATNFYILAVKETTNIGLDSEGFNYIPCVDVNYVLFIPSGSDSLIDSNGDTFKVIE